MQSVLDAVVIKLLVVAAVASHEVTKIEHGTSPKKRSSARM